MLRDDRITRSLASVIAASAKGGYLELIDLSGKRVEDRVAVVEVGTRGSTVVLKTLYNPPCDCQGVSLYAQNGEHLLTASEIFVQKGRVLVVNIEVGAV